MYISEMKRYRQFEPVLISGFKMLEWNHPEHNHNHYEFIFIREGSGRHIVNGHSFPYEEGAIFLLGPDDQHYFEIEQLTHFVYLKFTDAYLGRDTSGATPAIQQLEYIIKSRETHQMGFQLVGEDKLVIEQIFDILLLFKKDQIGNQELIWLQLFSIAHVLQRNMPELRSSSTKSRDLQAMFCYIHKNIYDPNCLRIQMMAEHFNIANDYLGIYFKRQAGITLRDYIQNYRSTLIRQRIAVGRVTLKEIAAEFGLTDVSHLTKIIHKT
ncbi:AraC family transcriptional regulator [Sphingobacterium sp.]|uniref:AraC family transcriptional regulator n=1 Tax=Sphingobacterium sp. TaxID=341027 RepID=UPI002588BE2F|nr:AraC family transcriptional regulator [Sphingobacterium sp.]WET67674.1 MAG: AraC family transcriptional regulator [Sphingobacterium sp.]